MRNPILLGKAFLQLLKKVIFSVVGPYIGRSVCLCVHTLHMLLTAIKDIVKENYNCNTPLKIKQTGKVTKIESKNALRGLKFDT